MSKVTKNLDMTKPQLEKVGAFFGALFRDVFRIIPKFA
jgi:hypothetical protein